MKLLEATRLSARGRDATGSQFRVSLLCGFTPLSVQTFVEAHLVEALPGRRIVVETGAYGDVLGSLVRAQAGESDATLCLIEWQDLDPRLSARSTAPHNLAILDEIVESASLRAGALQKALAGLRGRPLVVSLPTLELPPLFPSGTRLMSRWESGLELVRSTLANALTDENISVLNGSRLAQQSSPSERWSLRSELEFDFPFTLRHADILSRELVAALLLPTRRKGLVLDLDNTLWSGIIGDDGAQGVTWDLTSRSQHHAFFQRFANMLADSGVLLGVASKNDLALAEEGLGREDLLISRERIFPVQANWSAKSESISAIARIWNVGEDSLVFVDDSELEREEVERKHPGVKVLAFPVGDANLLPALMNALRDLLGTVTINAEDRIRIASIRNSASLVAQVDSSGELPDEVLSGLQARFKIIERSPDQAERALQLINKTNQFNINGRRWDPTEFRVALASGHRVISVEYEDRYGRLGEISSLLISEDDGVLRIHAWVLSCRAFARRIEHVTLRQILTQFGCREVQIAVANTGRNLPAFRMLKQLLESDESVPEVGWAAISTAGLLQRLPTAHGDMVSTFR